MQQEVWDVHHEGQPMPEQEGDDLVLVGAPRVSANCPITGVSGVSPKFSMESNLRGERQTLLEDPVKSTRCQHTYSRAAITASIQKKRGAPTKVNGR